MSEQKKQYTGKEVADAIKKACDDFGVTQEKLQIDILETGSTGIFGLIRKKAKIMVSLKSQEELEELGEIEPVLKKGVFEKTDEVENTTLLNVEEGNEEALQVSPEVIVMIEEVLGKMLEVMTFPSKVKVESRNTEILCMIDGEWNEYLTGQDGKTLDSIQYLLRKIIAKRTPERIKLTVDAGDFRTKRKDSLKKRAVELAEKVKQDGKTQVISSLNPSERRIVHMVLQDDNEIRSRSVGDGLFKKVLIFKPGKNHRGGGRKKQNYHGAQKRDRSR